MFLNYTRFECGVEVGVVTTFMLRLFVPHEFDMIKVITFLFLGPVLIYRRGGGRKGGGREEGRGGGI